MTTYPSVADIARSIRSGQVSATDVLDAHLERAAATREAINALVATRDDDARAEARRIDMQVRSGANPGPLAGVPFTVKDVLATGELPTTCGSRALARHQTPFDATPVLRLRKAGAILVGKTNTPEFAFGIQTVSELHGETRNPLGPFTVGGSSGGEAAAVAAGVSAFGIGTDFGGSLRWPAQCTGLVGHRPSVGLVSQHGQLPMFGDPRHPEPSLQALVQVTGPLTHDVRDTALVLSVMAGRHDLEDAATDEPDVSQLQISHGSELAGAHVDLEISAAVDAAAAALQTLGATVERSLPAALHSGAEVYDSLRNTDSHTALKAAVAGRWDEIEPRTRRLLESQPAEKNEALWQRRRVLLTELEGFMGDSGLLLLPVSNCVPFMPDERSVDDFAALLPSRVVSLFGLPAVSVPWTVSAQGRPISVQLVAPRMRDDLALGCARALELVRTREGALSS